MLLGLEEHRKIFYPSLKADYREKAYRDVEGMFGLLPSGKRLCGNIRNVN